MSTVRLGIVGMGSMGTNYARWITEGKVINIALTAICDADPKRTTKVVEELKVDIPCFTVTEQLFASNLVDAVLIATPHYFHVDIAIEAMKSGLHVLVEKPAGIYAGKIRKMDEEASRHPDLVYAMMFNQRVNPLYMKVKELLGSGAIGEIRRVSWMITSWWRTQKYYDSSSWRATWAGEGGGVLVNQAPHQIDLLQWLFGMPSKTMAFLKYGSHRDITVDDDATVWFELSGGASGTFITCTHDALGTDRLEVQGGKGKIIIENSSKLIVRRMEKSEEELNRSLDFKQSMALTRGQSGEKLFSEETFTIPEQWDVQHIDMLSNFAEAVLNGKEPVSVGNEGIKSVEFVNAMYLSDWLGRPVEIPVDPNLFESELKKRIHEENKIKNNQE